MYKDFFGPIEGISSTQRVLRKLTLKKERNLTDSSAKKLGKLLSQGQSTVFLPSFDFAYFFSLYDIVGRHLSRLLKTKSSLEVLEIGCGVGWGSYYLADRFPKVEFLATNLDEKSVGYASRVYSRKNLNFAVADGLNQKKFHGRFDLVYFLEVLEHLGQKNQIRLIRESLASLKPGGLIIFSTPSRESIYGFPTLGWVDHKMEYRSREQLLEFLSDQKFTSLAKSIEVNRLAGKQYARRRRIIIPLLFPLLSIGHLLTRWGLKFTFSRYFLEARKPLGTTSKDDTLLDLKYLLGLTKGVKRQTLALISVLERN